MWSEFFYKCYFKIIQSFYFSFSSSFSSLSEEKEENDNEKGNYLLYHANKIWPRFIIILC